MKKTLTLMALALVLSGCQSGGEATPDAPLSLRGDVAVAASAPAAPVASYPDKGASVAVVSVGQPPVIPHSADYPINLEKNGCIRCHQGGKQKMAQSHFADGKVDGQYYQCTVCHVPQARNY